MSYASEYDYIQAHPGYRDPTFRSVHGGDWDDGGIEIVGDWPTHILIARELLEHPTLTYVTWDDPIATFWDGHRYQATDYMPRVIGFKLIGEPP